MMKFWVWQNNGWQETYYFTAKSYQDLFNQVKEQLGWDEFYYRED